MTIGCRRVPPIPSAGSDASSVPSSRSLSAMFWSALEAGKLCLDHDPQLDL